jgi:hypothetical protein
MQSFNHLLVGPLLLLPEELSLHHTWCSFTSKSSFYSLKTEIHSLKISVVHLLKVSIIDWLEFYFNFLESYLFIISGAHSPVNPVFIH